ncbi:unnamed protein product [Brassicogethes aeneus]|uniref:Uncharacterized protein n=1 Tax=Brassicogethes aeneus TaxID=1431903 RepID=A0A9P0B364_BRAAE|nr:unnamed protein product [Brassicogethes aeneus]
MSPLDFRNTDLVSRLLAATPPYLYNMSLLPNTFFFSEMLRSLVQAKVAEQNRNTPGIHSSHRRSRKRTWSTTRAECFQKQHSPKGSEKPAGENNDWMLKSNNFTKEEIPLELTINKVDNNMSDQENKSLLYPGKVEPFNPPNKPDLSMDHLFSNHTATNSETPSNLVLPPPPPMWYPPLYPAPPYGIDPLHFFIDLRVSGHIYDRKNQNKDPPSTIVSPLVKDKSPSVSPCKLEEPPNKLSKDFFKQSRHSSAFSVPIPSSNKSPMNLTHLNQNENKQTKFDVKSMGFDKSSNKVSTNYIMGNINNIYSSVRCAKIDKFEDTPSKQDEEIKHHDDEDTNRSKKLKTLLDLEYVVDYMNNTKNTQNSSANSNNSSEEESIGSPALEVVALQDEN